MAIEDDPGSTGSAAVWALVWHRCGSYRWRSSFGGGSLLSAWHGGGPLPVAPCLHKSSSCWGWSSISSGAIWGYLCTALFAPLGCVSTNSKPKALQLLHYKVSYVSLAWLQLPDIVLTCKWTPQPPALHTATALSKISSIREHDIKTCSECFLSAGNSTLRSTAQNK